MIVRFINVIDEVSVLESVTDVFRNVLHEKQKLNELKELEILLSDAKKRLSVRKWIFLFRK